MEKISIFLLLSIGFLSFLTTKVSAVYDPLSLPNNKFGIHILFDIELQKASQLVNSTGGEWGYVLIPIQAGDKDLVKWQKFMDECKKYKLIPIIRLATEGDYFNTKVWRKPKEEDVLDFANFLHSLSWPVKNRYIIVFNEVNRSDEWGGDLSPSEYGSILSYAVSVFKSKSDEFFIISAGLDNAAPSNGLYMNEYEYMRMMHYSLPGIFNQIDGLASHSYPNPAFSQPPSSNTPQSAASFRYERDLAQSLSNKALPVFITETGWTDSIGDEKRAEYYKEAFESLWSDPGIVAVTPFLLRAGGGPFKQFAFLQGDDSPTKQHDMIEKLQKTKGRPILEERVLGTEAASKQQTAPISAPVVYFAQNPDGKKDKIGVSNILQSSFSWIMKL
ncbi:MAG: hypothetical protein HY431_02700 [Candidatus Levybacteria bacterium]|nr:hypothetical protein [Candidatus Levybacteria bacterium]